MYFGYVRENNKQGNNNCIIQHEYFIIKPCQQRSLRILALQQCWQIQIHVIEDQHAYISRKNVSLKYDKSKYCNVAIFIMAIGTFILQMVQAWYILLNACSICTIKIPSTTMKIALSYVYVSYTYIYMYYKRVVNYCNYRYI